MTGKIFSLIGGIGLLAALTLLIVTGHDTSVLVSAIIALAPVVGGIAITLDKTTTIQKQTNGNTGDLISLIAGLQKDKTDLANKLAQSVPVNSVTVTPNPTDKVG